MFSADRTCMNWKAKVVENILRIAIHRDEHEDSPLPEGGKITKNHVDPCDIPALNDVLERLYREIGAFHVAFGGFDSVGNGYPKKFKTVLWLDLYDDKPLRGHSKSSTAVCPVFPTECPPKPTSGGPALKKGVHWTELDPVAKWKGSMPGKAPVASSNKNAPHGPLGKYHSSGSNESLIDSERPLLPGERFRPGRHGAFNFPHSFPIHE